MTVFLKQQNEAVWAEARESEISNSNMLALSQMWVQALAFIAVQAHTDVSLVGLKNQVVLITPII